jgi:pimeloyl-ACP methyl ester carboxylesterase
MRQDFPMPDQTQADSRPGALRWHPPADGDPRGGEGPLAQFGGQAPPAPAWFNEAIAVEPERGFVEAAGAKIEVLSWGDKTKQGLIFVHGNSAHADWWSFIAPQLSLDFRVASVSLAGMGASDWREKYSFETFAEEIHRAAEFAGLYEHGNKPIYVGHSFGGSQVYYAARRFPERMKGAILVDTGFGGPPPRGEEAERQAREAAARQAGGEQVASEGFRAPQQRATPNRVYPTLEAALARFRFMPPQSCENFYIADFIARRSLKRAALPEGGGEGWTWRFDPYLFAKLDRSAMQALPEQDGAPVVHIYGDRSNVMKRTRSGQPSPLPDGIPHIIIPDSDHHIMIDQPLALIAALRGVLATWKPA